MPRSYKRKLGTPKRGDYDDDRIENALDDVIENKVSFRQASECHGVPKSTIFRKYHGLNMKDLRRPPALSKVEEQKLVKAVAVAAAYGFPFTLNLRKFVQDYLNRKSVNLRCFEDNLPGSDWVRNFMKRNKQLSVRLAENTKRCKAALAVENINSYFDELPKTWKF